MNSPELWSAVILAVAAIAAYSRTFSVPLIFDDVPAIADNPTLRHWSTVLRPTIDTTAAGRPIVNLSLAINYAISGTEVWGYHAFNLLIHILAGLTLFGILRRTLRPWAGAVASQAAFFATLLWVLHPLQTESVTYIVQRAESLMGLFYLLTLYCFIRGAEADGRSSRPWFALSVGACLLGMATKEVMVSAPLMVLLYDRTLLGGGFREAWRRRLKAYVGLAATWLVLLVLVLSAHNRGGSAGFGTSVSFWTYAPTQFPAICRYLKLTVWPQPQVFYYGTEWVTNAWTVLPAAMLVAGLLAASVWALFRPSFYGKALGFAGAWFFAILAPTSLVPIVRQTAAEHRMYLALIPLVVLAVIAIYRWLGRWALPFCVLISVGLFGITFQRNEVYRSALSLWTDTVVKCPLNAFAHYNLGYTLEKLPGRLNEAILEYKEALRLDPSIPEAHTNLGNVLAKEGQTQQAIHELEAALRIRPHSAEAHNNLGNALEKMPGRLNDAIVEFEEALRLKPDYAEAHDNLGSSLSAEGRTSDAIAQFEKALRLEPRLAEAHYNMGNTLAQMPGRSDDAIVQYEEALRLKPDYAEAHNNLGNVLTANGRMQEAIAQYEEALRLKPDFAEAHNNLGRFLSAAGRASDAIAQYEEALRLKPDFPNAHYNLGNALVVAGRTQEAIDQYKEALRLKPDYAEAHINLGSVLTAENRTREAISELETALQLSPGSAAGHINLGNALIAEGRQKEAIKQYEEALRLNPDIADAHFNLAVVLLKTPGHADEARAHLEAVLRLQPNNDEARQILAGINSSEP